MERQATANLTTTPQEFLRQFQQAIELSRSHRQQQPLLVPVVNISQANAGMTTSVNGPAVAQSASGVSARESTPSYAYKVKIINPTRKSDVILRQLNRFTAMFESPTDIRMKLIDEFGEQVPNTVDFTVGYFEGSQQAKIWIVSADDLQTMYQKYPSGGNITLWCDGRQATSSNSNSQKRKQDSESSTYRQEKEGEVESVYKELHEKHSDKYDTPRLRLWARMIAAGIHTDHHNPPNIPAFSGSVPKRARRESLSDAISSAAVAFVDSIREKHCEKPDISEKATSSPTSTVLHVSPSKAVDLCMKNYQQLRYLQSLLDDGILTESEYAEQKQSIRLSLRKL